VTVFLVRDDEPWHSQALKKRRELKDMTSTPLSIINILKDKIQFPNYFSIHASTFDKWYPQRCDLEPEKKVK
jgi:hypothetical protein